MQASPATKEPDGRTPAQIYCLVFGTVLLIAGALGFIVNSSFEGAGAAVALQDGEVVSGDKLLWFEVNGWHNVVHLASGLALLAAAPRRGIAVAAAAIFAVTYVLVTIIGLIDGSDVFGVIPVNTADNILHAVIAITGLLVVSAPVRPDTAYRPQEGEAHAAPPSRSPIR